MPKKRTSPNRNVQIADQIQRDLSDLIREVKDPRIGIVTFQSVELTPDYAHAKVYFTTLTGDAQATERAAQAEGHAVPPPLRDAHAQHHQVVRAGGRRDQHGGQQEAEELFEGQHGPG